MNCNITLIEISKTWCVVLNIEGFFYHKSNIYKISAFKGTLMQIWKSPYMFVFI